MNLYLLITYYYRIRSISQLRQLQKYEFLQINIIYS